MQTRHWFALLVATAWVGGCAAGADPDSQLPTFMPADSSTPADPTGGPQPGDDGNFDDDGSNVDEGLDDGADDAVDDDGGVQFLGCCQRHEEPSCQDPAVADCVCAMYPECCGESWSQMCVEEGVALGCMECAGPADDGADDGVDEGALDDGGLEGGTDGAMDSGGAPPGGGAQDCCSISATGGCSDAAVQACVCAVDSFCCESEWDDLCVEMVTEESCGMCAGGMPPGDGGGDGGSGGGAPAGACCSPTNTPGCSNPVVEACVCFEDPFCCLFSWDPVCVEIITEVACGTC